MSDLFGGFGGLLSPGTRFCGVWQFFENEKCTACGEENPPGTKFCGCCGTKL